MLNPGTQTVGSSLRSVVSPLLDGCADLKASAAAASVLRAPISARRGICASALAADWQGRIRDRCYYMIADDFRIPSYEEGRLAKSFQPQNCIRILQNPERYKLPRKLARTSSEKPVSKSRLSLSSFRAMMTKPDRGTPRPFNWIQSKLK